MKQLVINENGDMFAEEVKRYPVTNPSRLAQMWVSPPPFCMPLCNDRKFIVVNNKMYFTKRLHEIEINSMWTSESTELGEYIETCRFDLRDGDGSLESRTWKPPCPVFFVLEVKQDTDLMLKRFEPSMQTMYLFAVDKEAETLRNLPLPNIFTDSRLCTGELGQIYGGFEGLIDEVVDRWSKNLWQSDEYHDWKREQSAKHLRYNPENQEQMEPAQSWRDWKAVAPNVEKEVMKEIFNACT